MSAPVNISIVEEHHLSPGQKAEILQLQLACFTDVTAEEVEEDFCVPRIAVACAYCKEELAACAGIFMRVVEYEGQSVVVGGFGPCTRDVFRGQGIGSRLCKAAMAYLTRMGCDIAFLSIGSKEVNEEQYRSRLRFYQRLGFRELDEAFVYANVRGEFKSDTGGLIAPLVSSELFESILHGKTSMSLTPEVGYW